MRSASSGERQKEREEERKKNAQYVALFLNENYSRVLRERACVQNDV